MAFIFLSVSLGIAKYVWVFHLSISYPSDYEISLQIIVGCTNQIKETFFLEFVVIEKSCDC